MSTIEGWDGRGRSTRPRPPVYLTWSIRPRQRRRRTGVGGATGRPPMATRIAAASFLVVAALVAWVTITVPFAARVLQLVIAVSMFYVAWLAWHGGRVMRRAYAEARSGAGEPRSGG